MALLPPDELVQALLIRYNPGSGIGWAGTGRGSSMSSASRSAPRRRCVSGGAGPVASTGRRRRSRRGLIYHPTGEARHQWEHSIPAIEAGARE
jgi:DNA oxidative demethylase